MVHPGLRWSLHAGIGLRVSSRGLALRHRGSRLVGGGCAAMVAGGKSTISRGCFSERPFAYIVEHMPNGSQRRPDPEEILRRVQAQEKQESQGRLKIFFGYASRVGKSFRMLDEGRRRKQRGQDVVIGSIQGKLAPDVQALLKTIEAIPGITTTVDGKTYEVMDLVAILRRRPQVCLVDELAYDNPPGSRNPQRWQDVKELLEKGISVVTAVNIQHVREQQGAVERITGKRAAQTVPEEFVRMAEEIVVVDVPPEDLRRRDTSNVADIRRLSELRELALLLAAAVVEEQLQRYLHSSGIEAPAPSQERLLVCITPRSNAQRMLQAARYVADRFHCDLLALSVKQKDLNSADEAAVQSHLDLARSVGAEVHVIESNEDAVSAIMEFAKEHGVTQLFLGHSQQEENWRSVLSRNPLDRLIEAAGNMDVRVFPQPSTQ